MIGSECVRELETVKIVCFKCFRIIPLIKFDILKIENKRLGNFSW